MPFFTYWNARYFQVQVKKFECFVRLKKRTQFFNFQKNLEKKLKLRTNFGALNEVMKSRLFNEI